MFDSSLPLNHQKHPTTQTPASCLIVCTPIFQTLYHTCKFGVCVYVCMSLCVCLYNAFVNVFRGPFWMGSGWY